MLATKIAGPGLSWIRNGENNYNEKKIEEAVDGSLQRLKTDYLDLYQLHWPERQTNFLGGLITFIIKMKKNGIILNQF